MTTIFLSIVGAPKHLIWGNLSACGCAVASLGAKRSRLHFRPLPTAIFPCRGQYRILTSSFSRASCRGNGGVPRGSHCRYRLNDLCQNPVEPHDAAILLPST